MSEAGFIVIVFAVAAALLALALTVWLTMLALTGAPFHTDLPSGTRIVTSGRGGVYPRGIPLGVVVGIEEADTGWRKSYLLRPMVRPEGVLTSTGAFTYSPPM